MTRTDLVMLAALAVGACTPAELQTVAAIADDVAKVAQVLCLADHAKLAHARAITVAPLCKTADDLAPYIAQARTPGKVRASCGLP